MQFQILNQKIEIKAESKIGSLDNVKHKPGGGDKKIFDDKEYLKQIEHPIPITPPSQVKELITDNDTITHTNTDTILNERK